MQGNDIAMFALIVSICSVLVMLIFNIKSQSHTNREDIVESASKMAEITVQLRNIADGINDIKSEINALKSETQKDHDKLIEVDKSVRALWRQFDEYRGMPQRKEEYNTVE